MNVSHISYVTGALVSNTGNNETVDGLLMTSAAGRVHKCQAEHPVSSGL